VGYSRDKHIRWLASSGGVATSILMFMLREKLVDGALVVGMDGLKPKPFIAKSPEDLMQAIGSKYLPTSLNVKLKDLLESKGKYAIVGLPCHIRTIRRIMAESMDLQEKLVLLIGLFCCRTLSPTGFKVLLRKLKVREEAVKEFKFRGYGWPGNLRVSLNNEKIISIPYFSYWRPLYSPYFFTPRACMFCSDMMNEEADVSLGDAWLPRIMKKDNLGSSIIISRTKRAEEILREARRKGFIELKRIDEKDVIKAQWRPLFFKKITLPARLMLTKHKSIEPFNFMLGLNSTNSLSILCALIQLANIKFSESFLGSRIIEKLPFKLLLFYAVFHAIVEYLSWRHTI